MDLKFDVNNQTITRKDSNKAVNMSEAYLRLCFDMSDDWEDMTDYFIYFKCSDGDYRFSLTDDETTTTGIVKVITVPGLLLTGKKFIFGVFGVRDGIVRITTNLMLVRLGDSKFTDGGVAILETLEHKVDKIEGKGLSSNDYTDTDKEIVTTSKEYLDTLSEEFMGIINSHLETIIDEISESITTETFYTKAQVNSIVSDLKYEMNNRVVLVQPEATIIQTGDNLALTAHLIKDGIGLENATINFYNITED